MYLDCLQMQVPTYRNHLHILKLKLPMFLLLSFSFSFTLQVSLQDSGFQLCCSLSQYNWNHSYRIQEYLIEIFVSPWVENHCCRRIKKRGKIMKIIIERKKLNNFLQHGGTFVFQNNNKYKFPYYNGTKNISINPFVPSVLVFCNLKVPIVDYRIICSIHVAFTLVDVVQVQFIPTSTPV